jgi:hypothetical protein
MNDETLEQQLKNLPALELPAKWGTKILSTALREAGAKRPRRAWPPFLLYLRSLFARNPITASALTALWILIFVFRATTPVDPAEKNLIAHYDPNRPIYIVSLQDEIFLAQLLDEEPQPRQIP